MFNNALKAEEVGVYKESLEPAVSSNALFLHAIRHSLHNVLISDLKALQLSRNNTYYIKNIYIK